MADRTLDGAKVEFLTTDIDGESVWLRLILKEDTLMLSVDDGEMTIETELSKKELHVIVAVIGNMAQMMPSLRLSGVPTPADVLHQLQNMPTEEGGELKEVVVDE